MSEAKSNSDVKRYRKRPVECEAMLMRGYGDFNRAKDWVVANGGRAHVTFSASGDRLTIFTIDGNIADVFEGWYVVRGIGGEFYPCRADIFDASHELIEEPETVENLTGTGLYQDHEQPDGRTSLQGGAAKRLRSDGTDGSWAGD